MASLRQLDPSQTAMLRRQFAADVQRRMNWLKGQVADFLVLDDELGLMPRRRLVLHAGRYAFETTDKKLKEFNAWIKAKVEQGVLSTPADADPVKPWTSKYVDGAYRKGILRGYNDVHRDDLAKPAGFIEGTKAEFLRSSFGQPEAMSKVKLLGTRSFENLKGITSDMAAKLNRVLADGLAQGKGATQIAREINKQIDGITRQRALVLARTEVIHAHAEGQLDALELQGIKEVNAEVEFRSAGDNVVCPQCEALYGQVFTIAQARGVIPVHPNCRCAWAPFLRKYMKFRKPQLTPRQRAKILERKSKVKK